MAVSTENPSIGNPTDSYPLLMEPQESNENHGHVIDIEGDCDASSSGSYHNGSSHGSTGSHEEARSTISVPIPITQSSSSSSNRSNSRSSSVTRRGEGSDRHRWTLCNTILWLSIQLAFTLAQIIAAIVVLSLSEQENPQTPLFAWIVGYAAASAASLPIIYWRYIHRSQGTERGLTQLSQDSSEGNSSSQTNSYITVSLTRSSEEEGIQNTSSRSWNGQSMRALNARLSALMDHLKMALDCFFAVWFVVGNVWVFGGNSSPSDAPNLYRLCIVFLTISCIGYAMPFILCSMICCCFPCIISILGVRDDMNRTRGASEEIINALPIHKFKSKEKENCNSRDSNSGVDEGGFVAEGTDRERVISGEDAVCCICLARYSDNDELRELPCSHFFHTECVDKWLKINASCPLCKFEIGDNDGNLPSLADSSQQV
ncbi:hypothetical protein U1Q18_028532 [Sarracenia purpurea var. burkii]